MIVFNASGEEWQWFFHFLTFVPEALTSAFGFICFIYREWLFPVVLLQLVKGDIFSRYGSH